MVCACKGRKLYKDMKTLEWGDSNYNKSYALTLSQVKKCKKPTPTLSCVWNANPTKSQAFHASNALLCYLSHSPMYYAMLKVYGVSANALLCYLSHSSMYYAMLKIYGVSANVHCNDLLLMEGVIMQSLFGGGTGSRKLRSSMVSLYFWIVVLLVCECGLLSV